jgi:hypothetical protein
MVKVEACSETGETGPPELTKHSLTPQRPSDYNFQTFRLLVQRYAEKNTLMQTDLLFERHDGNFLNRGILSATIWGLAKGTWPWSQNQGYPKRTF